MKPTEIGQKSVNRYRTTNVRIYMLQNKEKEIKNPKVEARSFRVRHIKVIPGGVKRLAKACNVTEKTVFRALRYMGDTPDQRLVRKKAKDLNLIRDEFELVD